MKPFHVGVAAEAFAAGLFAQVGCDVSVQYGANQPEYDLLVSKDDQFLKISVKGSQDGAWGLTQSYKKGRSYSEAIDHWKKRHSSMVVFCFVQFKGVPLGHCPRVYLARVGEVAQFMKHSRNGHGETILFEHHEWKTGVGAGAVDILPENWKFSQDRVDDLLKNVK